MTSDKKKIVMCNLCGKPVRNTYGEITNPNALNLIDHLRSDHKVTNFAGLDRMLKSKETYTLMTLEDLQIEIATEKALSNLQQKKGEDEYALYEQMALEEEEIKSITRELSEPDN